MNGILIDAPPQPPVHLRGGVLIGLETPEDRSAERQLVRPQIDRVRVTIRRSVQLPNEEWVSVELGAEAPIALDEAEEAIRALYADLDGKVRTAVAAAKPARVPTTPARKQPVLEHPVAAFRRYCQEHEVAEEVARDAVQRCRGNYRLALEDLQGKNGGGKGK